MAGLALDESPIPEENLGFELPDSDAMLYSVGARYRISDSLDIGMAYLYDAKESRDVHNDKINGTFDDAAAHLVSCGLTFKL